jgi:hypothetical protein
LDDIRSGFEVGNFIFSIGENKIGVPVEIFRTNVFGG